jgi:hypothetical protein
VIDGDVEVDDVAVEQDTLIWDAVADNLVWRRAQRLGEVVVVERRGVGLEGLERGEIIIKRRTYIALYACLVADLVEVIRSDAWLKLGCRHIQHLSSQPTYFAHSLLAFGV